MAYDYGNYANRDVDPQYAQRRPQENNSTLYLIGKVALCALSWYATIVLDSPILAAVTVVIGVSIIYDLFCMALGGDEPPTRREDNDGYVRVNDRPQTHIPVALGKEHARRGTGYDELYQPISVFPPKQQTHGTKRRDNAGRGNTGPRTTRANVGARDPMHRVPLSAPPPVPTSVLSNKRTGVGDRDEKEAFFASTVLSSMPDNVEYTVSSNRRVGLGQRREVNSSSPPFISIDASEWNNPDSAVSGLGNRDANDFPFPVSQQSRPPLGERNNKPSSSGDSFAELFRKEGPPNVVSTAPPRPPPIPPSTSGNTRTAAAVNGNRVGLGTRSNLED